MNTVRPYLKLRLYLIYLLQLHFVDGKKQFETQRFDALQSKKKGRPSVKKETKKPSKQSSVEGSPEALQAEINRLRMENEYLKKLNPFVQNNGKSPRKTK